MNILVAMPLYKVMDVSCVISFIGCVSSLQNEGHKVKCLFTNGFNAARARKSLVLGVIEEKDFVYDYVLWLDSDHFYKPQDLFSLIDTMKKYDLPMMSASYKMRGSEQTAAGTHVDGKFKHYIDSELSGDLQECDIVGFGFLVMRNGFLEELWKKCNSLKEFVSPENFKSYDQLKTRLDAVLGTKRTPVAKSDESFESEEVRSAPTSTSEDDEDDTLSYFQKLAEE